MGGKFKATPAHWLKQRAKYFKEYRCREKTRAAVKAGKITKTPCFVCGETKVEAHHNDYDNYLDVQWLCRSHHKELHMKRKQGV